MRRYAQKAVLFGDGAKGSRLQIHEIVEVIGDSDMRSTGIVVTNTKENRDAAWIETVEYKQAVQGNAAMAIAEYEKDYPDGPPTPSAPGDVPGLRLDDGPGGVAVDPGAGASGEAVRHPDPPEPV